MKRKMLLISLLLVVLLTALMPAAAFASTDYRYHSAPVSEDFTGYGMIYVTNMPPPIVHGKIWRYNNEVVEGFLQDCDWDLLAGTVFWSTHDSIVLVQNDGSARGIMWGQFTLTRPDGTGVLEGFFEGRISGNLYTGFISDAGMWVSTGGSGVFERVRASGRWSSDLSYDPGIGTLVGPLEWQGRYKLR